MLYKRYGSLDFWTTKGIQWTTGVGLVYSGTKAALKLSGIQYRIDPTSAKGLHLTWSAVFSQRWKNSDLPMAERSIFAEFQSAQ